MQSRKKNISGVNIARRRREIRPPMTQLELARAVRKLGVGLDRAAIAKIETGIRGVLDYELVAIAKALRVPVAKMIGGEGKTL
jgi:transcriptional regulator with XRE-family HTH domain